MQLHPRYRCQQLPIIEYCRKNGIQLEACCPLGRGTYLDHPDILEIANEHNATPAQVLLRWSIQHGFIPLPKSDHPARIRENADVFHFKLTAEEMKTLDNMDQGTEGALIPQYTDCP
jgi:diketogulonate reductase-like aldo/keto reductase